MSSGAWRLLSADGVEYLSEQPGQFGGHRRSKIYGRLDCPGALRAIARGSYVKHRVFFLDAEAARAAGYRPCAVCMREAYRQWKLGAANAAIAAVRRPGKSAPTVRPLPTLKALLTEQTEVLGVVVQALSSKHSCL